MGYLNKTVLSKEAVLLEALIRRRSYTQFNGRTLFNVDLKQSSAVLEFGVKPAWMLYSDKKKVFNCQSKLEWF